MLISWKYYYPSLKKDVQVYVKGYNICLLSKTVKPKLYSDFRVLPVLIYQ